MADVLEWNDMDRYLTAKQEKPNNNKVTQDVKPSTSNTNLVAIE